MQRELYCSLAWLTRHKNIKVEVSKRTTLIHMANLVCACKQLTRREQFRLSSPIGKAQTGPSRAGMKSTLRFAHPWMTLSAQTSFPPTSLMIRNTSKISNPERALTIMWSYGNQISSHGKSMDQKFVELKTHGTSASKTRGKTCLWTSGSGAVEMAGARTSMIQLCLGTSNTIPSRWSLMTSRQTNSLSYSRITLTPSTKPAGPRSRVMATKPPISTRVKPVSTNMASLSSKWRRRAGMEKTMDKKLLLPKNSFSDRPWLILNKNLNQDSFSNSIWARAAYVTQ